MRVAVLGVCLGCRLPTVWFTVYVEWCTYSISAIVGLLGLVGVSQRVTRAEVYEWDSYEYYRLNTECQKGRISSA